MMRIFTKWLPRLKGGRQTFKHLSKVSREPKRKAN